MKLPCGCEMEKVGDAFIVEPCSLDCPYYLYVMKQSKKMNHPVFYMHLEEDRKG